MYNHFLFNEIVVIEAKIICRNCNEEIKYTFEGKEETETTFRCRCGKCGLKVFPRENRYQPYGEYTDNSMSVVEPMFKSRKEWRG